VQAAARAHRLGQERHVLASFLFVPDSLDEAIIRAFRRKASQLSIFLDADIPKPAGEHQNVVADNVAD
jgi:SNF2 family DNA or RNA helicase